METVALFKSKEGERVFMEAYERVLANWPVAYETRMVSTGIGRTHVIVSGPVDAPPLLLLHGNTANASMWLPNLEALSREFRVYALDLPGDCGKSELNEIAKSADDYMRWLGDLLNELQLTRVHLAGLSFGGFLAMRYALHAPERVERLVLLAPAATLQKIRLKFFFRVYLSALVPKPWMVRRTLGSFTAKGKEPAEYWVEQFTLAMKHSRMMVRVFPKVATDEQLRSLQMPVLVLVGDEEMIYDGAAAVERARQLIPQVTAELVTGAGHTISADQAELVNQRMVRFLQDA